MINQPHRTSLNRPVSRRGFLGIAGLTLTAGALSCAGGLAGYLLLDRATRAAPSARAGRPAPLTPRPATLKQIDRPPIILRADWGAVEPDHSAVNEPGFYSLTNVEGWREYEGDLRAIYRTVVIHHSVVYEEDDPATMREIQKEHLEDRGWADIAYHFGVGKTGAVFDGRDLMARGTHVEHYNTGSVGVVFLGNFEVDVPTVEQLEAGRRLIDWLALRLELTHLAGHHDFNNFTECPGRSLAYYEAAFAESAGLELGTGGYSPPPEQLTPSPEPEGD